MGVCAARMFEKEIGERERAQTNYITKKERKKDGRRREHGPLPMMKKKKNVEEKTYTERDRN